MGFGFTTPGGQFAKSNFHNLNQSVIFRISNAGNGWEAPYFDYQIIHEYTNKQARIGQV